MVCCPMYIVYVYASDARLDAQVGLCVYAKDGQINAQMDNYYTIARQNERKKTPTGARKKTDESKSLRIQ